TLPTGGSTASRLWNRTITFEGNKVYQRDDLIDPNLTDELGRTNLQRMQEGLAPKGPDGHSITLHHMLQTQEGPLAEVTQTFHEGNSSTIHINPSTIPSGIDRDAFRDWREQYWMNRALDFLSGE
ncbi:MAG: HNH/ENDO VII family nuclease, partial [Anaerolineae bacterium]